MARTPRQSGEDMEDAPDREDDENRLAPDEDDDCGHLNAAPHGWAESPSNSFGASSLGAFRNGMPSASSANLYTTSARDGLNLRSGPGTNFPVIRSLPFGTQVSLLQREERWGLIDEHGDGAADGFVHLAFLTEGALKGGGIGSLASSEQVRVFWSARNPRGARLYDGHGNPLVDPSLLHASALAIAELETASSSYRYEMYGPGGGFRTSGSTPNHTAQSQTGRGAAMDFVIIDRGTGRMLTNHPGASHQNQGKVGENAPVYQRLYNAVVRAGAKIYPGFEKKARFGGYFATGANAMDTMHIDMRGGIASTAGGSLEEGFKPTQMSKWGIPENWPYAAVP